MAKAYRSRIGIGTVAALVLVALAIGVAAWVGPGHGPRWAVQREAMDVQTDPDTGQHFRVIKGQREPIEDSAPLAESPLRPEHIQTLSEQGQAPQITEQVVVDGGSYYRLTARKHYGIWSLLPAFIAIALCLLTRQPIAALLAGIVVGAVMLGQWDLTEDVLLPALETPAAAGVLLLYLWLLGGLLGIWSKTGAARAFADFATDHFVKGPRSAKFVAWLLGVVFFQGGTHSTILVGTTVKPIADRQKIAHEELAYIVDSTASPIASVIAINAWPLYVQALIFVPGVAFLATDSDRLAFFFSSVPLSFYGLFAVVGTFLLAMGKLPFVGRGMAAAIDRARYQGQLDGPGAEPLSAKELETADVPEGYVPWVGEFFIPILTLLGIAIGTFIFTGAVMKGSVFQGTPEIYWAFGAALAVAAGLALVRGMALGDVMDGFGNGLKGVVVASAILMLAITIGRITSQAGGGFYLVDRLGDAVPYWALPAMLVLITMVISFATGTSWGTYAVTFPLAMPLAWAVANSQDVGHPKFFMMICFATVLNGSVYGDQCSPISDTTILSSMTTGCDLMDHVKTQLVPASIAMAAAIMCWEVLTLAFV